MASIPPFVLCLFQDTCHRMIKLAWSSSTDRQSLKWGAKPTGRFILHMQPVVGCHRRLNLVTNNPAVLYRWREWQPGFPMSIDACRHKDLPRDIQFDSEKGVDFVLNYSKAYVLPLTACLKALTGLQWLWGQLSVGHQPQRSFSMQSIPDEMLSRSLITCFYFLYSGLPGKQRQHCVFITGDICIVLHAGVWHINTTAQNRYKWQLFARCDSPHVALNKAKNDKPLKMMYDYMWFH